MEIQFAKSDVTRLTVITAPTLMELVKKVNENHEGMARAIFFGRDDSATNPDEAFVAIFDRALQVVMTLDDALAVNGDTMEFDEDSDEETSGNKLNLAA